MSKEDALLNALAEVRDIADNAHDLRGQDRAQALQACADIAIAAIGAHWEATKA